MYWFDTTSSFNKYSGTMKILLCFHFPMFGFGDQIVMKFEPHWVPFPCIIIKEHVKKICFKSWFTKTYASEKCNTYIEYNEILDPWSISVMHVLPATSQDISL